MYENKYGFSDYKNFRKYCNLSLESNHYKLLSFYHRLNEFRSLVPRTKKTKIRKKNVFKILQNHIIHCLPSIIKNTMMLYIKRRSEW